MLASAEELAEVLGTTKETVRRWVLDGLFQPVSRNPMRFDVDAAIRWREAVLAERASRIGTEPFAMSVGSSKGTVARIAAEAGLQPNEKGRYDREALQRVWTAHVERIEAEREEREDRELSRRIISLCNQIIRRWEQKAKLAEAEARKPRRLGTYEVEVGALATLVGEKESRVLRWVPRAIPVQYLPNFVSFDLTDVIAQAERGRIVLGREAENRLKAEYETRREQLV